ATAFSGFYLVCIALLVALIFRAVAIEFRSKELSTRWRRGWDIVFAIGSVIPQILFGLVIGNVIIGLRIGANGELPSFSFLALLKPFPILVGFFVLSLFTLHGAIYLNMKTEGELQARVQRWAKKLFFCFLALWITTTGVTLFCFPQASAPFHQHWWPWVLAV